MQLGIPITTINGGINAVKILILYPNRCIVPRLNSTPMITTVNDNNIELNERKKSNRINADKIIDTIRNHRISPDILIESSVLINGSPLRYTGRLYFLPKPSAICFMS